MSEQTERIEKIYWKIRPGVEERLREKINWERSGLALKRSGEIRKRAHLEGWPYARIIKEEGKTSPAENKERENQAITIVLERDLKPLVYDAVRWAGGMEEDADVLYRFMKQRKTEQLQGSCGQSSLLSWVKENDDGASKNG